MDKVNEDYWYNQWHLDTDLHQKLGVSEVTQISKEENVSIYADTDSCHKDSKVITDQGIYTIEDWYNKNLVNGSAGNTVLGHQSVKTDEKILNYSDANDVYFASVKRIIRHKVSKQKWRLRTKSGKDILITNDHSMIVFRNGNQLEVKPQEILKTDKILVIKK